MNTEDFQFFLRVANLGSISQAAKEANIAVSVASQKIRRLETQLKLRLFHRTTRKLSLTEEAKILIEQGTPFIKGLQTLAENLKHNDQQLSGIIHMTASAIFATHVLIPAIAKFMKQHPELRIHLDLNDQNINLIERGMDLAIRIGPIQDSSLVAKRLCKNPRLLCAAPEYIDKFGTPTSLEDLKQHQCIVQHHQHGISDTWFFEDIEGKPQSVEVSGNFITNSGEGVRQAALAGLGISNHSFWHVQEDLTQGKLLQILPNYTVRTTQIYAVIPDKNFTPYKVKLLIEYLEVYLQSHFRYK